MQALWWQCQAARGASPAHAVAHTAPPALNGRQLSHVAKGSRVMASSPCDSGHQGYETAACEGYAGRPRRRPATLARGEGAAGAWRSPVRLSRADFCPFFAAFPGKTVQKPYRNRTFPYKFRTPPTIGRKRADSHIPRGVFALRAVTGDRNKTHANKSPRDTPAPVRVQPAANSRQYRTDDRSSVDRCHKVGGASTNHANLAHLRTKIARKTGRIPAKKPQNTP